ncbi:hypothetical protein [uncultured Sphingomonas sp.]|uniref:hypothetical protein n=1 Tax=uncultured Sphingomonas sp. TaxID=158754 RepID=UPI0025DA27FB|nr:hypothetical protein [uncultured Sphingomonas sp.]
MHTVTFFPIGNADSCLIELENGRRALFDFADMRNPNDENDKRCDLAQEIRDRMGKHKEIDVVAFTHLDTDHCKGAKDFFHLEHAEKYQGEGRYKIKTMWVPANAILEVGVKGQARTLRAEARHRFIAGEGIRVFSQPDELDEFLIDRGIDPDQRRNLITDAGTLCPEFNLDHDGVEFFAHSPFAEREDGVIVVRNDSAIFAQATFEVDGEQTRLILSADIGHETIAEIVRVTQDHGHDDRLAWDINNVPHHSSYTSLGPDKGEDETEPTDNLKWLYEDQGRAGGLLVSTSCSIPDEDSLQPPHRQAAAYYSRVAKELGGSYVVTMEHPSIDAPKPLVIEIGTKGYAIRKKAGGAPTVLTSATPRAG